MPITVMIIDDEELAIKRIENLLMDMSNINIIGTCKTGTEAIKKIKTLKPELIFLDIQLKDITGFDILEQLPKENIPLTIFTTAFNEFALKAFDFFAFDYLLKPFKDERFYKSVNRAIKTLSQNEEESFSAEINKLLKYIKNPNQQEYRTSIPIKLGNKISFIKSHNVKYIIASGYYSEIHALEKKHVLRESLSKLILELGNNSFIRIHRSTIINIQFVQELISSNYGELDVKMSDNKILRVSKSYKKQFLKKMGV
ncbi:LytR/AlgR family response regulator transcription factor [Pontimicrobium aquaticum]|uniref:Response regulator n=1 Tax=Pontimicrobium aquaticum TaxID=2565367 RepID=A0A4U0F098_9FLAO|nr:response regulator [Pontimicrobium aquaticum]TJY37815.1 response regulator [Pontimicrobium aquaticum]